MRGIALISVIFILLLTGCAHMSAGSAPSDEEQALAECRSEADKRHSARYTDDWNAFVERCMEAKGFEN